MRYMETTPANDAHAAPLVMTSLVIVTFLANLVYAYVLAIVMALANPSSALAAASLGFMVAAGFVVTTQMNAVLFEKRPMYAARHQSPGANIITSIVGCARALLDLRLRKGG